MLGGVKETTTATILANKETYYEQITRVVRWFAIAVVLATFPSSSPNFSIMLVAAVAAIVFNLLRYSRLMRWRFFASRITTIVVDNLLVAILLALSGGVNSHYFVFWAFTIISTSYWYGATGTTIVLTFEGLATLGISLVTSTALPTDLIRNLVAKFLTLVAIGFLAERLTQADRSERTTLTQANRQIERERQSLLTLINSLTDAVVVVDAGGRVMLYNGATLDLLNTNIELTNQPLAERIELVDEHEHPVAVRDLITAATVATRRSDLRMVRDGEHLNLDLGVSPVHDANQDPGQSPRYVFVLADITASKTLEQQQADFISVTSHELRTPLAIVEADLSTVLLPNFAAIDAKARGIIAQAHQNTVFLADLIKDLSTLARAERGSLAVDLGTVDPAKLLEALVRDYRAQAEAKGLTLTVETAHSPKPFNSSEFLLHEILQDLLTNALKYTEHGGVTLTARPSPTGAGVVFSVQDSGLGISAADQKRLFTKFYRSADERVQSHKGTGLGLYIGARLAERLGATIGFTSRLGRGSTFTVQVPPYQESAGAKPDSA